MINNYAKNNLLPSPEKKKYSRDHLIFLVFIYYFKSILSIKDVQTILTPLAESFFHDSSTGHMLQIYERIADLETEEMGGFDESILHLLKRSTESFSNLGFSEDEESYLSLFALICMLSYDIYIKKTLIERIIDMLHRPDEK